MLNSEIKKKDVMYSNSFYKKFGQGHSFKKYFVGGGKAGKQGILQILYSKSCENLNLERF